MLNFSIQSYSTKISENESQSQFYEQSIPIYENNQNSIFNYFNPRNYYNQILNNQILGSSMNNYQSLTSIPRQNHSQSGSYFRRGNKSPNTNFKVQFNPPPNQSNNEQSIRIIGQPYNSQNLINNPQIEDRQFQQDDKLQCNNKIQQIFFYVRQIYKNTQKSGKIINKSLLQNFQQGIAFGKLKDIQTNNKIFYQFVNKQKQLIQSLIRLFKIECQESICLKAIYFMIINFSKLKNYYEKQSNKLLVGVCGFVISKQTQKTYRNIIQNQINSKYLPQYQGIHQQMDQMYNVLNKMSYPSVSNLERKQIWFIDEYLMIIINLIRQKNQYLPKQKHHLNILIINTLLRDLKYLSDFKILKCIVLQFFSEIQNYQQIIKACQELKIEDPIIFGRLAQYILNVGTTDKYIYDLPRIQKILLKIK